MRNAPDIADIDDIEIIDTSIKYNVYLALRYARGYAFPNCDISISETTPSGKTSTSKHRFTTMDSNGYNGEGAGDIYDLEEI